MKTISYNRGTKKFLLTEKEYNRAVEAWGKKANYACSRLGNVLLTPYYDWTDTPDEDKGCDEIYFLVDSEKHYKVFKRNDKYYYRQVDLAVYEREVPAEAFAKAKKDNLLIDQEKYYEEKMYEKK